MRTQGTGLLRWAAIGLICGGLVGCAGRTTKAPSQAPGTAGGQTQKATGAAAKGAGKSTQQQPSVKLGEEVEIPGSTQIETTKKEARVERHTIPTIEQRSVKANINKMTVDDFVALGLDRDSAENVIQYRMKLGPFASVEELGTVPGVDLAWVDRTGDRLAAG